MAAATLSHLRRSLPAFELLLVCENCFLIWIDREYRVTHSVCGWLVQDYQTMATNVDLSERLNQVI